MNNLSIFLLILRDSGNFKWIIPESFVLHYIYSPAGFSIESGDFL